MHRREFLLAGSAAMLWPAPAFAQQARDTVDIVIIGAGGAGLSAAIVAKDAGASVLVLEKMPLIGGNTQLAAGGMNAAETPLQAANGVKDEWRWMYEDTMKGGGDRNQTELVETDDQRFGRCGEMADRSRRPIRSPQAARRRTRRSFALAAGWRGLRPLHHPHPVRQCRQAPGADPAQLEGRRAAAASRWRGAGPGRPGPARHAL